MKRIFSILLVFAMMFALASCGAKPTAPDPAPTPDASQSEPVEAPGDTSQAPAEGDSPAQQLLTVFKNYINSGAVYACESVADELISHEEILPFAGAVMDVEEGFLNGFTEEITGFEEGATFAPMIGSIPFVGYIFQVPEGEDVNAFMDNLKDKADLRWNICTQADEMVCDAIGNTVFFVMAPATFDDAQ